MNPKEAKKLDLAVAAGVAGALGAGTTAVFVAFARGLNSMNPNAFFTAWVGIGGKAGAAERAA